MIPLLKALFLESGAHYYISQVDLSPFSNIWLHSIATASNNQQQLQHQQTAKTMAAAAATKALWAPVKWAQRKDAIYVTVDLPDVKDEKVTLSNKNLTFQCVLLPPRLSVRTKRAILTCVPTNY